METQTAAGVLTTFYIVFFGKIAATVILLTFAIMKVNRSKTLSESQKRSWIIMICLIPIFGSLYFLLFRKKS